VLVTEAGEWRVAQMIAGWEAALGLPVEVLPDTRFVCPLPVFRAWAEGRKALRVEYFYRDMRRRTGLLMEGDKPAGGEWNYDAENRKAAPDDMFMPKPRGFAPDAITEEVFALVEARFGNHFGDLAPGAAIHMLTANAFADDVSRYLTAGADGVLTKPIDVPSLFAVLANCGKGVVSHRAADSQR
jgi:deoxyribodipyrimidine photolyase-related protein